MDRMSRGIAVIIVTAFVICGALGTSIKRLQRVKRNDYGSKLPVSDFPVQQIYNYVNTHNNIRRQEGVANMRYISWNPMLAQLATDHIRRCYDIQQSPYPTRDLWGQIEGFTDWNTLGYNWQVYQMNAPDDYDYVLNQWQRPGSPERTQMIWADTSEIGCARYTCNTDMRLLCLYGPSGRHGGVANVPGPPCSRCSSYFPECSNGLCRRTDNTCPGFNQQYYPCGPCEGTCSNRYPACTQECRPGACGCRQGYVRINNVCSEPSECTGGTTGVVWQPWQEWSICHSDCTRIRYRVCSVNTQCGTDVMRTEQCTGGDCLNQQVGLTQWGPWTQCSAGCRQQGYRTRNRSCNPPSNPQCAQVTLREQVSCQGACSQGTWGAWGPYGQCTCSPGSSTGQYSRTRPCSVPNTCAGNSIDTQQCLCQQATGTSWGPWGAFAACQCSSGTSGQQSRLRTCSVPNQCIGNAVDSQICQCQSSTTWSNWSSWSPCYCSAGATQGVHSSSRNCPVPNSCSGTSFRTQTCQCQATASWSNWSQWTQCSVTCGSGQITRQRSCMNQACGQSLQTQSQTCQQPACQAQPVWSPWTQWSTCSVTCGVGQISRQRTCLNQACQPVETQQQSCQLPPCRQQGTWGAWGPYNQCTCVTPGSGIGIYTRTRTCSVANTCVGSSIDRQQCQCQQVSGGTWSAWGPYGQCSCTPGTGVLTGTWTRSRTCSVPNTCTGVSTETQLCQCQAVSGGTWSPWGAFGQCVCQGNTGSGQQSRLRTCPVVNTCPGTAIDTRTCSCQSSGIGTWSAWGTFAQCICSSGQTSGVHVRQRTCSVPGTCSGVPFEQRTCSCGATAGTWSYWTLFTNCTCAPGINAGTQVRSRICLGTGCQGESTDSQACSCSQTTGCTCEGQWGDWHCSVECGTGALTRTRSCARCPGQPTHIRGNCTIPPDQCDNAPVGSNYAQWGAWSACSATCITTGLPAPTRTRFRSCLPNRLCPIQTIREPGFCNALSNCQDSSNCCAWTPLWCNKGCNEAGMLQQNLVCTPECTHLQRVNTTTQPCFGSCTPFGTRITGELARRTANINQPIMTRADEDADKDEQDENDNTK